jgi:hypothetical protein
MFLHNMCGYGNCKSGICYGCRHVNLYLVIGKHEYKLPKFINKFLKLFWGR